MQQTRPSAPRVHAVADKPVERINSRDLFQQMREVEIAHEGRIYRLRLTQLNKLILTA
ncbi:hemin uptake protein HemP [uncultured Oxalicibacterium sp.]|uniref:hemin uptake protein HemP n=1 Tax=uncultured Oxalicibacterium sp. TaxID=1168540 RepID=UPI0025CF660A|nr:hemin uptake protein HemP [uncultured Oxalicibacterium sp.]